MKNYLCELTEAEQEKLLILSEEYTERELVKEVAKPKPEEFGLELSRATIGRMVRELRARKMLEQGEEVRKQARAVKAQQGDAGSELEEGALAMLRQRFFQEAASTMRTTDVALMYRSMKELLLKEQRVALARDRARISQEHLELAREQFQFNAARAALEYCGELQRIWDDKQLDNEDKILRARERMFGKEVIAGIRELRK